MPFAGTQVRHFGRLSVVDRLEDLQLFTLADKHPRIAALALFQPHAVVFAAHGRAIASQTQPIKIIAGDPPDAAIWLKLDDTALSVAIDDGPFTAQVSGVERALEAGARWRTCRDCFFCCAEMLFRTGIAGALHQLITFELQLVGCAAIDIHLPRTVRIRGDLALGQFKAIVGRGLARGGVDVPFQCRSIGQQRLAQVATFGRRIDGRLVDPDAVRGLVGMAGATAQQRGQQREGERDAHMHAESFLCSERGGGAFVYAPRGIYSMTSAASISTWAPRGRAATPMAARAGYGCSKYLPMISLTLAKWLRSVRKMFSLTMSLNEPPAASATALRFSKTWVVWASKPSTSSMVFGSSGIWPDM